MSRGILVGSDVGAAGAARDQSRHFLFRAAEAGRQAVLASFDDATSQS